MEHPVKAAPCPLLFASNGGQFDSSGHPIVGGLSIVYESMDEAETDDDSRFATMLCDKPFDCGSCPLLHQWVSERMAEGWHVEWECPDCLKASYRVERDNVYCDRMLPGFYQAGRSPSLREEDDDFDPDRPALSGCTSCGRGSSFLQLILRRGRSGV